jgi:hypothetical protein
MHDKLKKLSSQVWKTEKSRFTAAERSRKQHQAIVFAISFLSITQLIFAISEICGFNIPLFEANKTGYLTLMTSVVILVIANQDSLSKLLSHSDSYHRCANKLHKLQHEIETKSTLESIDQDTLTNLTERYSDILDCHDLNHLPIDYKFMLCENHEAKNKCFLCNIYIRAIYSINIYMLPVTYCLLPFAVALIAKKIN